ncbi:ras-related protein Rab-38 isoform X1 [Plectropomus leopardus]|uniref:ras-related protein Rab-38 isoform X1 n=1 Tax=Plectropomus leopardus TaxID=160734 RepID=UPI001C4D2787|nr:ras-related protein Rab-38 isoform X1 [Plectropomus leopardus]XP_042368531.1 ras-related protein Rab-38 isoform X1 [Plectropomus leopardus]XP_042368532.1 ras-related protein Rab-38 isoform X1 [Plectropomus leopardus]
MQRERLLKVLVIGDLGVGKTSIIKRYVHQVFSQHYRATIGVDFALKVLNWDHKTVLRLQLWDIAGQERYGNMTRVYYREAVGALVVFDMTRLSTFQAVLKWKGDLDSKVALSNGTPVPAVLLANKCDQRSHGLCPKLPKLENFSREYGFVGWYETSAKPFTSIFSLQDNTNIDAAIMCLVKSIMTLEDERAASDAIAVEGKSEPVLVLPRFDYNAKEKGLSGCSGCQSLKTKDTSND